MNSREDMTPLVSVIVPVYNVDKYLSKCLETLIRQTYRNIEIILVDDGSNDLSGLICEKYSRKDKRIYAFHKTNGGLSSARNFGIKKATGKYLCFIDSDDYVEYDYIKSLLEVALSKSADIVVCGYDEVNPMAKVMSGKEATIKLLIDQENVDIVAWNKLYRRSLFKNIKYPEGENYEDTLTTYKLYSKAAKVIYVSKILYHYVQRENSITGNSRKKERLTARLKGANESKMYFDGDKELRMAAEISELTAHLAFIDFAIKGKINRENEKENRQWIIDNKTRLLKNKYLTKKLRIYIELLSKFGGIGYHLFRVIKHE